MLRLLWKKEPRFGDKTKIKTWRQRRKKRNIELEKR